MLIVFLTSVSFVSADSLNETVIDEVSEAGDIGDVCEVNAVDEVERFADGSPKNNVEETYGDDLINLSECSSIVLQVNDNEGVIAARRDATNQVDIQIKSGVWGDITYVKQYKEPDGYFAHVFVTSNGWLIGNGGVTDGSVFRQIESIACEMVVNNVINDAYLSRIHDILSQYSLGHFVIKAADGTYGVVFSEDVCHTGKLQPGEYVVCPNVYSYSQRGYYDASLSPVDAAIKLGYTDSYGVNRRDLITYDWKLTTSPNGISCSVDTYASNDNGAGVGRSTGGLADSIYYLDRSYISRDSLPGTPNKIGLGTYVFDNANFEIFKLLSPISTALVGDNIEIKFQVNYFKKSSPAVRFAIPEGFDFNSASVSKGSCTYYADSRNVLWNLNDCDANNYITLSLKALKPVQADLYFSLDNNFVNSVRLNANVYGALMSTGDVNKYYKGPEKLNVNLKDGDNNPIAGENVVININGKTYTRQTNDKGVASLALNLNSGSYVANINYNGRFGSNSTSADIKISDTVFGNDIVKMYKNNTQYYAKFLDTSGKPLANRDVSFNINGVFYTRTTDSSGVAKLNINLIPGEYTLTAINPVNGDQCSNKVKVLTVLVDGHDVTKYYRNASVYSIKVLDGMGNPLANADVSFNINGVFYTRQTNESGYANLNLRLPPGNYIITSEYNGLKYSNRINILPVLFGNDVVSYDGVSNFKVELIDGKGNPYPNQTIEFNLNNVIYTNITDSQGIAKLLISLPEGEHIVTSSYDEYRISNKITIKNEA